jgi:ParB-like chromosome segregation protein Spo0J
MGTVEDSKPTQLMLKEIKTDETTFQWRVSQFNKADSAEHLRVLTQALQNSNKPLDPIQLYRKEDGRYYVVEGHHRLAAYRKARWTQPVPVMVFEGTLEQAQLAAVDANVKNKLPMSDPEKSEAAWKLVTKFKHLKLSKTEIANRSGRSPSMVAIMRKAERRLIENGSDPKLLTWTKARAVGLEKAELSAQEWLEKKAEKIRDALLKANIVRELSKFPDATALALWMLNPNLPKALVHAWMAQDPDMGDEIVEALSTDEFDYRDVNDEEYEDVGDAQDSEGYNHCLSKLYRQKWCIG